ncbi:hypothetical protein EMPG_16097, partial [Blastomyces silverae]
PYGRQRISSPHRSRQPQHNAVATQPQTHPERPSSISIRPQTHSRLYSRFPIVSVTIGAVGRRYIPRRARNIPPPPLLELGIKRVSPEQHLKKTVLSLSPFARQWADKRRLSRTPIRRSFCSVTSCGTWQF